MLLIKKEKYHVYNQTILAVQPISGALDNPDRSKEVVEPGDRK